MRELWLMRHGKSDREATCPDFDRPLKPRGKRAAQRVGEWLKAHTLFPDYIVTSPAQRALHTAQRVANALELQDLLNQDVRLYFGGVDQIKALLADCPAEAQRVLIVGHNPDLEDLLAELVSAKFFPNTDKLLPTAALARLKMPADWKNLESECARLIEIVYPKKLPDVNGLENLR